MDKMDWMDKNGLLNGQWTMDNGQWTMDDGQGTGFFVVKRCAVYL